MAYRRWIWCRDTSTGHHIDVDERQLARLVKAGAVEPIPGYPVNEGPNVGPRPAKPNTGPTPDTTPKRATRTAAPANTEGAKP